MALFLEVIDAAGNATRLPVENGRIDIAAQPGTIYRLVDENGAAIGSGPRVLRIEEDLVITDLPQGEVIGLTEFFSACSPADPCTLSLAELGGSPGQTITPASEPMAALQEGGFLMNGDRQIEPALPVEPASDLNWKPIAAAGGGLLVLAGAAGGGGGGGGDEQPPAAPAISTTSVDSPKPIITGTAEPNARVTVTIDLGGSGEQVRYATTANANGTWSLDLANDSPILGVLPAAGLPIDAASPISLVAIDPAGNSSASSTASLVVDTTPPIAIATLVNVTDNTDPVSGTVTDNTSTNDSTPTLFGTLSAPLAAGELVAVFRDGVLIGQATVLGTNFSFVDGPLADSDGLTNVVYTVQARDTAGNTTAATPPFTLAIDTTPPGAVTVTAPNVGSAISAAQAQTGVTVSGTATPGADTVGVQVLFGTVARNVSVDSNNQWSTVFFTNDLPADGNQSITARAFDAAGNLGADAPSRVVALDRTPPALSITSDGGAVTNDPFLVTFQFSEAVTTFTAIDVNLSGGVASSFTGSGATYSMTVTPSANLQGNAVVSVAANAAVDSGGNPSTGDSLTQAVDTVVPTLLITDNVPGLNATGPVLFTFNFGEPVVGFTAVDVVILGGTGGALVSNAAGSIYTMVVTPAAAASGTIGVSVANGAAADTAGNPITGDSVTQAYVNDTIDPVLNITDNTVGTATGPVLFQFTFDEPVLNFVATDVTVVNGTRGVLTSNPAGSIYSMTITPTADDTGTMTVSVAGNAAQDAAGNGNNADSAAQLFNTEVAPTLVITDNAPASPPTRSPITYTFTFSEPVSNFNAADISISSGTLGPVTGGGAVYQAVVSPTLGDSGNLVVSVRANAAQDGDSNFNAGPITATAVPFDLENPTVVITDNTPAADATGPIVFTITFDEPITGFIASDLTITSDSDAPTSGTLTQVGASNVYQITVTPADDDSGVISVSLPVSSVTDASGNGNLPSTTVTQDYDTTAVVNGTGLVLTEQDLLGEQAVALETENDSTQASNVSAITGNLLPEFNPTPII